jgi:hypothetical protein
MSLYQDYPHISGIHHFIYKSVLLRRCKILNNNLKNLCSSSLTLPAGRWLWTVLWWHLSIILAKLPSEHCLWNITRYCISENTYLHKTTVQTQCLTSNGVLRMASYACSEKLYTLWCSLGNSSLPLGKKRHGTKSTWHRVYMAQSLRPQAKWGMPAVDTPSNSPSTVIRLSLD